MFSHPFIKKSDLLSLSILYSQSSDSDILSKLIEHKIIPEKTYFESRLLEIQQELSFFYLSLNENHQSLIYMNQCLILEFPLQLMFSDDFIISFVMTHKKSTDLIDYSQSNNFHFLKNRTKKHLQLLLLHQFMKTVEFSELNNLLLLFSDEELSDIFSDRSLVDLIETCDTDDTSTNDENSVLVFPVPSFFTNRPTLWSEKLIIQKNHSLGNLSASTIRSCDVLFRMNRNNYSLVVPRRNKLMTPVFSTAVNPQLFLQRSSRTSIADELDVFDLEKRNAFEYYADKVSNVQNTFFNKDFRRSHFSKIKALLYMIFIAPSELTLEEQHLSAIYLLLSKDGVLKNNLRQSYHSESFMMTVWLNKWSKILEGVPKRILEDIQSTPQNYEHLNNHLLRLEQPLNSDAIAIDSQENLQDVYAILYVYNNVV